MENKKGEIVKAFAGDVEAAFLEAAKLVDEMYRVTVDRRADIVVVSAGGHPADIDLYQAYKGLDNALDAVKTRRSHNPSRGMPRRTRQPSILRLDDTTRRRKNG